VSRHMMCKHSFCLLCAWCVWRRPVLHPSQCCCRPAAG
jgi:hypothetical protein